MSGWAKRLDWRCRRPSESLAEFHLRLWVATEAAEMAEFWDRVQRDTLDDLRQRWGL